MAGYLPQYNTYYGVYLNHIDETWGGLTYNKILVTEFPNEYLSTTSYELGQTARLLYLTLWKNKYYIDGIVEGHVSLYNESSTGSATLTSFTVSLRKTDDVPSNETVLGSYTKTISSDNIINKEDYLTLPVYMNVDKQLIDEGEKLLIYLEHNASAASVGWAHANDSTTIDMQIKIPFAPSG